MTRNQFLLWLIIFLTAVSILIDLPAIRIKGEFRGFKIDQTVGGYDLDWSIFGFRVKRDLEIKKGLDLQGGLQVVLRAKMGDIAAADRQSALESTKEVLERRVNFLGVSEPNLYTLQSRNDYRVVVELPGLQNSEQALELIGQTAQLDFRERDESPQAPAPFKKSGLTGRDLKHTQVGFDRTTGEPTVEIAFTEEGSKRFEEITKRNVEKPLAIYLDDEILQVPIVKQIIAGGEAVVSGKFTLEEAKRLAIQLNAGALPVPIEVLEQHLLGASLGADSIDKSIKAGLIGLSLVALFMVAYYRSLGILAVAALLIYGLITLALYKLIPVTLTLSGIAGFLLSIGMAVDSNILIFERIKEELKLGKPRPAALELGFGRAWDSIRDANAATLITAFILFNPWGFSFLNISGIVRGFALTLSLGILISLFTGIVVTRTLVRTFYG